jgi:hypothetical protein
MNIEEHIKKTVIAAEYRLLSELLEHFPKKSVHPVAKIIDKKMSTKLEQFQKLHNDEVNNEIVSALKHLLNEK